MQTYIASSFCLPNITLSTAIILSSVMKHFLSLLSLFCLSDFLPDIHLFSALLFSRYLSIDQLREDKITACLCLFSPQKNLTLNFPQKRRPFFFSGVLQSHSGIELLSVPRRWT